MCEIEKRELVESGFKVVLPMESSFRFSELDEYKKLSGLCLKEMDICWWDTAGGKLFLLELKGKDIWRGFDASAGDAHEQLTSSINGKATDSLILLASVWVKTNIGKKLKTSLPVNIQKYQGDGSIKLIFLIDTPASRKPLLAPLKDEINKKLAGRMRLFGVRHVTLIDFSTASKMGLPVEKHS